MGKKIDFFVLTAGIAAGFYLYFRSAFKNALISLILSVLCTMVLRHAANRILGRINNSVYMKKRRLRKCGGSAMMHLACMDEAEAAEKLRALIKKAYGSCHETALIQLHPASTLEQKDIFPVWKRYRNRDALVICATAHASPACRAMASELKRPKVALLDAGGLTHLIAEHPDGFFPIEEKQVHRKLRLRRFLDLFINRKNAPRCLLMFFSLFTIYVFSANIFYLLAALFLLFTALVSLRRQSRPAKLF